MTESKITYNTPDSIEIANDIAVKEGQDQPSVLFHAATWQAECGVEPGIAVEVFGPRAPLISAVNARILARWLNEAADNLEASE